MRILFTLGVISSASASVASFLSGRTKIDLLLTAIGSQFGRYDPLFNDLRKIFGNDTRQIVLEDFLIESDLDSLVSMIIDLRDIDGLLRKVTEGLPRFLDEKRAKCLYWSMPKTFRLRYDELVIASPGAISMTLPTVSTEWNIPDEGIFYGVISGPCIALQGPYVECNGIVFDLENKCSISIKNPPKLNSEVSTTYLRFFPGSRAIVQTALMEHRGVFAETVFLHKEEANPVENLITHDRKVAGPPLNMRINHRVIEEAPMRIFFNPANERYQVRNLESNFHYEMNQVDNILKSTREGFVKNRKYTPFGVNRVEFLLFGTGKVFIVFDDEEIDIGMAVYSYEQWETLPMEDRFVNYEHVPLPNLYHRNDLLVEVEEVASLVSAKITSRYPRLFRDELNNETGWVNKADIELFTELKESIDTFLESECFKHEVASLWQQGDIFPKLPLNELLESLHINIIHFLSLFMDLTKFKKFRELIVRDFDIGLRALKGVRFNPFDLNGELWLPFFALSALFQNAGCSTPKVLPAEFFIVTKETTSMKDLQAILQKYC